jgi:hypothetical protein
VQYLIFKFIVHFRNKIKVLRLERLSAEGKEVSAESKEVGVEGREAEF